jgi:hypothetical protein
MRGASIEPLYRTVPAAVVIDKTLHELLSIVDTFRIGRIREIEIAKVELDKILDTYDIN